MELNDGAVVAMKGKDCVAIASDRRFAIGAQTASTEFQKVFEMGPHLYIGFTGLATDAETVYKKLKLRHNLYELNEKRIMTPQTFCSVVCNLLYEYRLGPYMVEPIIAGLNLETLKPYVCSADTIGSYYEAEDYVVSGSCAKQLYGMCESLWEPDMSPDDLFETISQTLVNALDRDPFSGCGAIVHVIEKDKITTKTLKTRMD